MSNLGIFLLKNGKNWTILVKNFKEKNSAAGEIFLKNTCF